MKTLHTEYANYKKKHENVMNKLLPRLASAISSQKEKKLTYPFFFVYTP